MPSRLLFFFSFASFHWTTCSPEGTGKLTYGLKCSFWCFTVALHREPFLFRGMFYTCKTLGLTCVKHVFVVSICACHGHGSDHVHHLSRSPCLQRRNKPACAGEDFQYSSFILFPTYSLLPQYLSLSVCWFVCFTELLLLSFLLLTYWHTITHTDNKYAQIIL